MLFPNLYLFLFGTTTVGILTEGEVILFYKTGSACVFLSVQLTREKYFYLVCELSQSKRKV